MTGTGGLAHGKSTHREHKAYKAISITTWCHYQGVLGYIQFKYGNIKVEFLFFSNLTDDKHNSNT
jgi:hypothetical protein